MAYKRKLLKSETAEVYCNDFRNILKKSTSIDDAFDKVDVYQHDRDAAFTKAMELEERNDLKAKRTLAWILAGGLLTAAVGYYVYVNL